ncbi:amidohydrolase family protein [Aquimarina sp. 2201CG14-23]|uniref:amidohydrolase family protein n=1 Tax=Aquimarina mycalae TaxID=3040073 RepID=UPI0024782333|nr:amidohydrolase family protein [Aquimarina sp. 2201CG14-23]MDH7447338.1 amidohydrolase family protein [Aquimarina sp. 2201CG14-23]
MRRKTIKKWVLGITLTVITGSIVSCLGVKSQINQHLGKKTELVNTSNFKTSSGSIAIKNISALSSDCSQMLDSLTVLIKDGKIINVAKQVDITSDYTIVDGTGKYLIPGLIDTHVHLKNSKNDLLLYVANGITYVGEMTGSKRHLQWREEAKSGSLSPRIYVATRKVGSQKGIIRKIKGAFFDQPLNYTKTKKARKAVQKFKEQGFDAIKLNGTLNKEIYEAITNEAKKHNVPAIGHLSFSVGLDGLYSSGQSQLSHIEEITKNTMEDYTGIVYNTPNEYLDYLNQKSDSIAIKLKESNIIVASTISVIESVPKQNFDIENFLESIELEYENPGLIEGSKLAKGWLPGNNSYENMEIKNNPELVRKSKIFWETYVKAYYIMTKALIRNGVTITVGTDANVTGVIPGFSLHDELESLSKCGMSNSKILHAATIAPAQWMQSETGKIKIGYDADLVILEKNPLIDIKNSRTINTVIVNGKLLNRKELDSILQSVKEANNRSRKISIDKFIN